MNKYKSRENRLFEVLQQGAVIDDYILVIHKKTLQPLCGLVKGYFGKYDAMGNLKFDYVLWLEELGIEIDTRKGDYETFASGIF